VLAPTPRRPKTAPQIVNDDPALRLREGAEYLGVSVRTLRRYIKAGVLKGVRIGSQTLAVRRSECERYLNRPLAE
jgi:excisionase family DNA binding protein